MAHIKETELNRWAEGTLGGRRQRAVEDHLYRCRHCRVRARELTILCDALNRLPSLALTRAAEARVAAIPKAVRSAPETVSLWQRLERQWRSLAYVAVTAGVVTGCILGATVLDYFSSPMDGGDMVAAVALEEGYAGYLFAEEGGAY